MCSKHNYGVPVWLSSLRILCCHCSLGRCCGTGLTPWPRNFCVPLAWPKRISKQKTNKKIVYVSFSTCSWFNSSVWFKLKLVSMIFEERFVFIYLQTWGFTMTIISKKGFVNWHTWILIPVLPQRCYISYT